MNLGTMVAGAGVTKAGAPPHLPPLDFEDLVHRFGPRLLAVARRLLRSEEDARDAVQDGFVAAFHSMGGFQGHSSPETWLHRIVVNAALMRLRSRRRHPETSVEDLLPGFLEDGHHERHIHDWPESPERLLARHETREIVRSCIDRLPEIHRTMLILRDVEELSTEEAAALVGITEGAAKLRLHRARLALRGLLAPFFEPPRPSRSSPPPVTPA